MPASSPNHEESLQNALEQAARACDQLKESLANQQNENTAM